MEPGREPNGRIAYIDGLRAVAVLLVLAHHVARHAPHAPAVFPFLSVQHALLDGAHGVDLFFVLSGFCLSYPFLQRLRTSGAGLFDLPRYFAKRAIRIVPPYYGAIAIFTAAALLSHQAVHPLDVAKQALFVDWRTNFINGSFWTLAVEFRWYFLFPFAMLLWIRSWRWFALVALASTLAYTFTRMHAVDVGTLLPFMLGIVAADWDIRGVRIPSLWMKCVLCFLLAVVLERFAAMPSPYGPDTAVFYVQTNAGWQLAMFAFVVAAGANGWLRSILSLKPLTAIGMASYSIYLVHEPIVDAVQRFSALPAAQSGWAAYTAAVAAGFAFWAVLERPWTTGALKAKSTGFLEPYIRRIFNVLELPHTITKRGAGALPPLSPYFGQQQLLQRAEYLGDVAVFVRAGGLGAVDEAGDIGFEH